MENKISIEELIKNYEKYSKEYNQYMDYLKSVFTNILNPDLEDIMSKREIFVNSVIVYKENDDNYINVEYYDTTNKCGKELNIISSPKKIYIHNNYDNLDIYQRINKNIIPIISEVNDYIDNNDYCEKFSLDDIDYPNMKLFLEVWPHKLRLRGTFFEATHSFENKKVNNNLERFMYNGISYDMDGDVDFNKLKDVVSSKTIVTKQYIKELEEKSKKKVYKIEKEL